MDGVTQKGHCLTDGANLLADDEYHLKREITMAEETTPKPETAQSKSELSDGLGRMTIYDVVYKVVGEIEPIGETNEDNRRFDNLRAMTHLVNLLITDIDAMAYRNKDRVEFSMKRAGKFADEFLTKIGIAP